MQFNKHAMVLNVHSLLSAEERVSHDFLMLPLSFNTNYDVVSKHSANRAIILAKILSYASRAGLTFPHLRGFPSFFNDYRPTHLTPASKIVLTFAYIKPTHFLELTLDPRAAELAADRRPKKNYHLAS